MSRRILAVVVIIGGVLGVVPTVWLGTSLAILVGAWALHDLAGLHLSFLTANVAGPVGLLCGMGTGFLSALACGLVARGLLKSADA